MGPKKQDFWPNHWAEDQCHYKHYYQFGCGILKMMGPKKQDFWPNH
jgi:hypothetical protein